MVLVIAGAIARGECLVCATMNPGSSLDAVTSMSLQALLDKMLESSAAYVEDIIVRPLYMGEPRFADVQLPVMTQTYGTAAATMLSRVDVVLELIEHKLTTLELEDDGTALSYVRAMEEYRGQLFRDNILDRVRQLAGVMDRGAIINWVSGDYVMPTVDSSLSTLVKLVANAIAYKVLEEVLLGSMAAGAVSADDITWMLACMVSRIDSKIRAPADAIALMHG